MKIQLRILVITCLAVACALLCSCNKQSGTVKYHVALLKLGSHPLIDEVERNVKSGLTDKYGKTVEIAIYNGNFEPSLLKQSVDQISVGNYDVVIPITTPATASLVNSAKTNLNIVFSFVSNPETIWGRGNAKPVNVTGTSDQIDYEKNLQLIRSLFPKASRLGYLVNQGEPNAQAGFKSVSDLVSKYGFTLVPGSVSSPADVTQAANTIVGKIDVFLVGGDNTVVSGLGGILSVADREHIPVFAVEKTSVQKGCIASFGVDYGDLGRKTFELACLVLDGKKPSDIPIVYYTDTKLYVNKATLSAFHLSIPKNAYEIY